MGYFKTSDQAVLAAWDRTVAAKEAVHEEAKAFGLRFGGRGRCVDGGAGLHFGGVQFNPLKPTDIWTKPDDNRFQRPLARPRKGASAEMKTAHRSLRDEWAAHEPKTCARQDEFYEAIGTDWGALLFGGASFVRLEETIYIKTPVKLGAHVTEILGSEYMAAEQAAEGSRS